MAPSKDFFSKLLHRIVSIAWVYDLVQVGFFSRHFYRRISPYLDDAGSRMVLDVGAGTGLFARILPETVRYIWYDNDVQKLKGFKPSNLTFCAILGDGTQISLRDRSVDWAMCMALSHHLNDGQFSLLLAELARIVRQRVIFFDSIKNTDSIVSRLVQRYDRGNHHRSLNTLRSALSHRFEIEHKECFSVHKIPLVLFICRPKA